MNTAFTFTLASLIAGFLAICAGISCVAAAVGWIIKVVRAAKAPTKSLEARIAAIEKIIGEYAEYFANDKRRISAVEDGSRVTQRAILALLSHAIDGNDVDALKEAKTELQDYLIART